MSNYDHIYFYMKTTDPWITGTVVENTTSLHFRLNHWKMWHLMFHFQLWIDLWAIQARLSDTLHHKSNVAIVWQHAPSQVWAGLRFFFSPEGSVVFYKAASTSYYISHIQVWTVWWAVLTLKQQSLAYNFQEICDSCCGECLFVFFPFVFLSDLQSMFIVFKISSVSTNWSLL